LKKHLNIIQKIGISFQVFLDSFILTLHKISYYIYQHKYDYYYLSSLFKNKKNIKEIIDLILELTINKNFENKWRKY
jgi:hypothetical protein